MILKETTNNKIIPLSIEYDRGDGLKFDGVNDYVSAGNVLNFNYNQAVSFSTIFSISSFASTSGASPRLFAKILLSEQGFYASFDTLGRILITNRYTGSGFLAYAIRIETGFSLNTLYHLTFTKNTGYGANDVKTYVNGELQTNILFVPTSGTPTSTIHTNPFLIGAYTTGGNGQFQGTIYDMKFFNKELSSTEVQTLYQSNNVIVPSTAAANLQADWRFNQKAGTSLTDYSGNSYTGTLTNYAAGTTSLGASNMWVNRNGNPITAY